MLRHVGDMADMTPIRYAIPSPNAWTVGTGSIRLSRAATTIGRHLRRIGPVHILLRIVFIGVVALAISGIGHVLLRPARSGSNEAARLVTSLTEEGATLASLPPSFDSALGYQPVAVAGNLVDPYGGCSTPGGIGPGSFNTACQVHDLGYDVLRVAEIDGDRLGAWARFDIDLHFFNDLVDNCETASCRATAAVYYTAVTANSIRQGYRAPTEEPTLPWIGVVAMVVGLALIPPAGFIWRHRRQEAVGTPSGRDEDSSSITLTR